METDKSSYKTREEKLKSLSISPDTDNFCYDLLSAFGMSNAMIKRVRDGKGNLYKDGRTILVKKSIAYRKVSSGRMEEEMELMKADARIIKNARLYVVSDEKNVLAFDPLEKETYKGDISDLQYDYDFFMPLAGREKYHAVGEKEADVKAAYKLAKLYDVITNDNIHIQYDVNNLNVFMSRLLFCFFAEDTGIFEKGLFTNSIKNYTREDGSDLSEFICDAFSIMNEKDAFTRSISSPALQQFPYVNGGLFAKNLPIPILSWKARKYLLECGELNWSEINPDVFGSMIQAVISPEMRAVLGSHYTSVPNIMKVIQPLFLDGLYEEYCQSQNDEKKLKKLLMRLSHIKFFDPACGSGNFLIISYKEIRKLEMLVWERISVLTSETMLPFSSIKLTQFYGIEIDDFAKDTATLSLWLAEHQMNVEFGLRFHNDVSFLPLKPSGHIVRDNACRINWDDVCPHSQEDEVYVMGNPPYLGSKLQNAQQKEDLSIALHNLREKKTLDYISSWFWKGANYINSDKVKVAFVTTNSICQGEQVGMLWKYIYDLNLTINFAYSSFKWKNNAKDNAGVTCAIVGLSKNYSGKRKLFHNDTYDLVDNISPYLTKGNNIIVQKSYKTPSSLPKMCFGSMPYDNGNLIMSPREKEDFISLYPQDADLIKRLIGSQEFIRGEERFCFWISNDNLERAGANPHISERIEKTRAFRQSSSDKAGRYLTQRSHQFREFVEIQSDSIIIPGVSSEKREYIPIGFVDSSTIISNSAFAIYDAPLWLFGFLTSRIHMVWVKNIGGRLKTDYRYSAQLCYNTFPFPKLSDKRKNEISSLAEAVLLAREKHTEMTLGDMYDPKRMPQDLKEAHWALDQSIDRCYKSEPFSSDTERLEYLFRLYELGLKYTNGRQ